MTDYDKKQAFSVKKQAFYVRHIRQQRPHPALRPNGRAQMAKTPRRAYTDTMKTVDYDRPQAVAYARKWAFGRNPQYYDFSGLGGDCTNFVSQCLYAGSKVMNFIPVFGWYYRSANDRTASWTGVEYLYRFLISNSAEGPFAEEVPPEKIQAGDVLQLGRETGDFYHTCLVTGFGFGRMPLVAAHTTNAFARPLRTYSFEKLRCLHIAGVRVPDV